MGLLVVGRHSGHRSSVEYRLKSPRILYQVLDETLVGHGTPWLMVNRAGHNRSVCHGRWMVVTRVITHL